MDDTAAPTLATGTQNALELSASVALAFPEIFLAIAAMALLIFGVYRGDKSLPMLTWGALIAFAIAAIGITQQPEGRYLAFSGSFVVDAYAKFMKLMIYAASGVAVILSMNYIRQHRLDRFEFPVLIVLATLGMSMMVSANNLISLYMAIELQSLALYVMASINRDSVRSTEAGLKYFVLGALSSCFLLYGCSLIYGFTGSADFDVLRTIIASSEIELGVLFGLVFVCAALAFKVSAAPFHMWTPDVYEGAPTPVTAFFAAAPKVAAMALFIRLLTGPFGGDGPAPEWQQIIITVSLLSMIIGAFGAIGQTNIKRLMAYSSIGNMGYALLGLTAGNETGIYSVILYLLIYLATTVGIFACILSMKRNDRMIEDISQLAGLSKSQPLLAGGLMLLLFSLAGIPPLAGFFAKFWVFLAAVEAGLLWVAIIGILSSVIGAFYYLRLIKIMYFDDAEEPFDPMAGELSAVLIASVIFTIPAYLVLAHPLRTVTEQAANALFF